MRISFNERDMKSVVNALPDCCDNLFDISPHIGSISWFYSVKKGRKVSKSNSSSFIDFTDGVTATCTKCEKDYIIQWNDNKKKYETEEY